MANWKKIAESANKRAAKFKEKTREGFGHLVEIGTVAITAGGLGYARGALSDPNTEKDEFALFDIPAEIWIGAGFGLVGAAGLMGKQYSHIAVHIGAGATAQYLGLQGLALGAKARVDKNKAAITVQTQRRRRIDGGTTPGVGDGMSATRSRARAR